MQDKLDEVIAVDPSHLSSISISIGRHIKWGLINYEDTSGTTWNIVQELTRFSMVAAQTFAEITSLGNAITLEQFVTHVVEPFGNTLCQQIVLGTYSYVECLIQLGKNIFSFFDGKEECTDEELLIINRNTTFSMTAHHQFQLAVNSPMSHVTFH